MFMAIEIHQSSMQSLYLLPTIPKLQNTKNLKQISVVNHSKNRISAIRGPNRFIPKSAIRAPNQSSGRLDGTQEPGVLSYDHTIPEIKTSLDQSLQGINRGIFGVQSARKTEIEGLVKLLESKNPTPNPTENLDKVDGCWKLVYSTISILGSKRTKLGLRDFIALGDFLQIIDVAEVIFSLWRTIMYVGNGSIPSHKTFPTSMGKAVNAINFSARGLRMLSGQLTIEASFKITSQTRVDIKYESSTIAPDQLLNLFKKNYDLLLGIFNPEGWLEISYVDESMRIGRDDKSNLFVLERV